GGAAGIIGFGGCWCSERTDENRPAHSRFGSVNLLHVGHYGFPFPLHICSQVWFILLSHNVFHQHVDHQLNPWRRFVGVVILPRFTRDPYLVNAEPGPDTVHHGLTYLFGQIDSSVTITTSVVGTVPTMDQEPAPPKFP